MLEVVTVWTPRPQHSKWRDYMQLLALQRASVARVGLSHRVVSDVPLQGYDTLEADLPESLMHAMLAGALAYARQWSGVHPVVLLDVDCLVCRDLRQAFTGEFDVLLTNRPDPLAPIQNGAMYFAPGNGAAAVALFERALELCEEKWGGDQSAIAAAVAPVPEMHCVQERFGARFAFVSTELHNHSTKGGMPKRAPTRFVEHFKGDLKIHAAEFARTVLGIAA